MTAPAPVLLIVGGDSRDVETTASALDRRFGSDYRLLTAGSAADGLAELNELARSAEQVRLVAADLHLPDGDGVEFLERAAGLHHGVARILLFDLDDYHTRIPFRELPALQRASALGRIDGWMVMTWVNPDEWLYPQVQEALSAWSTAHQPRHLVYDINQSRPCLANCRWTGLNLPALLRRAMPAVGRLTWAGSVVLGSAVAPPRSPSGLAA